MVIKINFQINSQKYGIFYSLSRSLIYVCVADSAATSSKFVFIVLVVFGVGIKILCPSLALLLVTSQLLSPQNAAASSKSLKIYLSYMVGLYQYQTRGPVSNDNVYTTQLVVVVK